MEFAASTSRHLLATIAGIANCAISSALPSAALDARVIPTSAPQTGQLVQILGRLGVELQRPCKRVEDLRGRILVAALL